MQGVCHEIHSKVLSMKQAQPICQKHIPYDPEKPRPLPGIQPLGAEPWLHVDDAYAAQMAERERLLEAIPEAVHAMSPDALPAAQELLQEVLDGLPDTFERDGDCVICPDGREVTLDWDAPLMTAGRLVQNDLCLMQEGPEGEHILTGAVLCFPAGWRLSEKYMRPLTAIHIPVPSYDENIAKRVQRLFNGVQPGRAIWRFNAHWYDDPALHAPRTETDPRRPSLNPERAGFLRSERQVILRLQSTKAVVFSIHTFVLRRGEWITPPPQ
jgi:hypothetical protein